MVHGKDSLIVEGIVTSINGDGEVNIAPMGPRVDRGFQRMTLKPFKTSTTYQNLKAHPEGVFHVVDNVLLLAQAAVGQLDPAPIMIMAQQVKGFLLQDACRFYEFRVEHINDTADRAEIDVKVVWHGKFREYLGLNRAMHAVVEAAILATRTSILPPEQIDEELERVSSWVEKTGGLREKEAFVFLRNYIAEQRKRGGG